MFNGHERYEHHQRYVREFAQPLTVLDGGSIVARNVQKDEVRSRISQQRTRLMHGSHLRDDFDPLVRL